MSSFLDLKQLGIFIKCPDILIYGAGEYGKRLLILLKMAGIGDRVVGYAVSNLCEDMQWDGYDIRPYAKYSGFLENTTVFIAMNEKNSKEVYSRIKYDNCGEIQIISKKIFDEIPKLMRLYFTNIPLKNSVLFYCYFGKGFSCNCKYIALEMLRRKLPYELFFDSKQDRTYQLPIGVRPASKGTYDYYRAAYTSKIIVSNEEYDSEISKREGQYYIMTWHGAGPLKKIGVDVPGCNKEQRQYLENMFSKYDLCISCNDFSEWQYHNALLYKGEVFKSGYPRNDVFFGDTNSIKSKVINELGLDSTKGIVLYAPTFRMNSDFIPERYDIDFIRVLDALRIRFGKEYQVLFRKHYSIDDVDGDLALLKYSINVTDYADTQELLVAADVLITDYSSVMWDFSLQRKPVFLYHSDLDLYLDDRGFYCSPNRWPYPIGKSTDELCDAIIKYSNEEYQRDLSEWFCEYGTYDDGHASERVVDKIIEMINRS